jgi:ribosome-associated protein
MEPVDKNGVPLPPSKSQRKRDMTALQKMGGVLVDLPASELAKIPMQDRLSDAIYAARALTTHGAKRRQLQYIGRLMRDEEMEPIYQALETIHSQNQQGKAHFHQLERWRDRLIAEGDGALRVFVELFPDTDVQHLRQLIRNTQKNPTVGTELFRYLRKVAEK